MGRTKKTPTTSMTGAAQDRLRARCPLGPPYAILILDHESVEALTHGAVNSRTMVEAFKALEALQPLPLPKDYPAHE